MKREHLNLIYDVAIHAAVEAIQLAAMVKKYERSQRHDWPGGWVPDYGTGPEPLKKKGRGNGMILAKDDIEKAVSWWAGKLMDHQPHSNGDDSLPLLQCASLRIRCDRALRWIS